MLFISIFICSSVYFACSSVFLVYLAPARLGIVVVVVVVSVFLVFAVVWSRLFEGIEFLLSGCIGALAELFRGRGGSPPPPKKKKKKKKIRLKSITVT